MTAGRKELAPLFNLIKKGGRYKPVPNGKQHYKIIDTRTGQAVQDDDGPVIISSSPSEFRARDMHVHRLLAAKVIPHDPWKPPGKKEGGKSPFNDPDKAAAINAAKIEAIKEKSRENNRLTLELRGRLEPLIVHLGGWNTAVGRAVGSGVRVSELGLVAQHWANVNHRVGVWKTASAATSAANNLRHGNTMGESARELFTLLIDELERAYKRGGKEGLRERYFGQLLRQAKNLPGQEAGLPEPGGNGSGDRTRIAREEAHPITPVTVPGPSALPGDTSEVPTLALKCLAEMLHGRAVETATEDPEAKDRAIGLAEDVLRLELKGR